MTVPVLVVDDPPDREPETTPRRSSPCRPLPAMVGALIVVLVAAVLVAVRHDATAKMPALPDLYGAEFKAAYEAAETAGLYVRQIKARDLYGRMMRMLAETESRS